MRENCSALYPNELIAQVVTEYDDRNSLQLDREVCKCHEQTVVAQKRPCHAMSLLQARFLTWMARSMAAKRVLDIGSSNTFSLTMWAHAVDRRGIVTGVGCGTSSGKKRIAEFQRSNVEVLDGDAMSLLPSLMVDKPYDIIFISVDKSPWSAYLESILHRSRPGTRNRLIQPGGLLIVEHGPRPAERPVQTEASLGLYTEFLPTADEPYREVKKVDDISRVMYANRRIEAVLVPIFEGLTMGRVID